MNKLFCKKNLYFFISLSLFLVNIGISLYFYVYISLYPSLSFFSLFPLSLMSIFVSLHAILSLSLSLSLPHTHSQSHSFASQLHTLFRSLTFLTLCVQLSPFIFIARLMGTTDTFRHPITSPKHDEKMTKIESLTSFGRYDNCCDQMLD